MILVDETCLKQLHSEQALEVCDATKDDSSNAADTMTFIIY